MGDVSDVDPKDVKLLFIKAKPWTSVNTALLGKWEIPDLWKLWVQGVDRFLFLIVKLINRFAIKIFQIFGLNSHYNIFTDNLAPIYGSFFTVFNPITIVSAIFGINVMRSFFSSVGSHSGFPTKLFLQDFMATAGLVTVIIIFCSNPAGMILWGLNLAYRITVGFAGGALGMPNTPGSNPVVHQLSGSFLVETFTANFHGNIKGSGCDDLWLNALAHQGTNRSQETINALAYCFQQNGFIDAEKYMDGGAGCFVDLLISVLTAISFAGFVMKFSIRVFMSVLRWIMCVFVLAWVLVAQAWQRKKFSEMGGNIIACAGNLLATILYSLILLVGNLIIIAFASSLYHVADPHRNFPEIILVLMMLLYCIGYALASMVDKKVISFVESLSKGSRIGKINNLLPLQPVKAARGIYNNKFGDGFSAGGAADMVKSLAMRGLGATPLGPAIQGAMLAKRAAGSAARMVKPTSKTVPDVFDDEGLENREDIEDSTDATKLPAAKVLNSSAKPRTASPKSKAPAKAIASKNGAKTATGTVKKAAASKATNKTANKTVTKAAAQKAKSKAKTSISGGTKVATQSATGGTENMTSSTTPSVALSNNKTTVDPSIQGVAPNTNTTPNANVTPNTSVTPSRRKSRRENIIAEKKKVDLQEKITNAEIKDNMSPDDRAIETRTRRADNMRAMQSSTSKSRQALTKNAGNIGNTKSAENAKNATSQEDTAARFRQVRRNKLNLLEIESTGEVRERKLVSRTVNNEDSQNSQDREVSQAVIGSRPSAGNSIKEVSGRRMGKLSDLSTDS